MDADIQKMKRRMLIKYPLFGSSITDVEFVENSETKTAETDGKTIFYNPNFLNKLTEDEQTFLFAHEVCHIAFEHIKRSKGKRPKEWNIATDAIINALLQQDGLQIIEGGVDMDDAINYDAEELYNKLIDVGVGVPDDQVSDDDKSNEQQDNSNSNDNSGKQGNSNNSKSGEQEHNSEGQNGSSIEQGENVNDDEEHQDVGHDSHKMWAKAIEEKEDSKKTDEGTQEKEQTNEKQGDGDNKNDNGKEKQEEKTEEDEMGEKKQFEKNKELRKKQLNDLMDAISEEVREAGKTTNSEQIQIDDIGKSKPLIDWRMLLREAIKSEIDWSYKNAEIEDGVVRPKLEEFPQPETEIVLDTSGSINHTLLKNFLRECRNILQVSKVKVGCFDTKFYDFQEVRKEADIDNMKFRGGGGTDFNVAVNAFSKRVENKIIFTDGEADIPKNMPLGIIWIVFGQREINPKGGKVIYITKEQLRKLYNSFKQEQSR